jgi:dihydrofolate synthase/folylpolyglutamate synthase
MKSGVPVVIGETVPETKSVFIRHAGEVGTSLVFAEEENLLLRAEKGNDGRWMYRTAGYGIVQGELGGDYQVKNANTLLSAVNQLTKIGYRIGEGDVHNGFAHVSTLTGLSGRWQKLREHPTLVCDTGHNVAGIACIVSQLKKERYDKLHIVIGMVNDKDINGMLALLPKDAGYYFTKASVMRALPEKELMRLASFAGLKGECYPNVVAAVKVAEERSLPGDFIFVGGSTFVVGDLLAGSRLVEKRI